MSDKAVTEAIQKDWKEREMIEVVHLNILKVSRFFFRTQQQDVQQLRTRIAFSTQQLPRIDHVWCSLFSSDMVCSPLQGGSWLSQGLPVM